MVKRNEKEEKEWDELKKIQRRWRWIGQTGRMICM